MAHDSDRTGDGATAHEVYPEVLGFDEAAEFLGVSSKTFAKVLRLENLPGRKVGREWKFAKSAILDWLSAGSSRDYHDDDGDAVVEAASSESPSSERPLPRRGAGAPPPELRRGSRRDAYAAEED